MSTEIALEMLRERRRALLWWSVGVAAFMLMMVLFYPSVRDVTGLNDYGEDLPEAMRALFTGGESDLISPAGYLDSQVFASLAPLLFLIFAIGLGGSAVAGEEERGRLELVLAAPVRREAIVLQRFAAMVGLVLAMAVVMIATLALGGPLVDLSIGFENLLAASGSVALLAILFGAAALAVGSVRPGKGRADAIAAALAIAAWVLDGLGQAVGSLEPWRPLSPFYQAFSDDPVRSGVPWEGWAILVAMTAAFVVVAVLGFSRRDLRN